MKWPRRRRTDDQPPPVPPRPPSGRVEEVRPGDRYAGPPRQEPQSRPGRDGEHVTPTVAGAALPHPGVPSGRRYPDVPAAGVPAGGAPARPAPGTPGAAAEPAPGSGSRHAARSGTGSAAGQGPGSGDEAAVTDLAVRFATATAALVCTGRLATLSHPQAVEHRRAADGSSWWVVMRVALDVGRQVAATTDGEVFLRGANGLVRDPGWGSADRATAHAGRRPSASGPRTLESLRPATLLDLVRRAGLHAVAGQEVAEAVVVVRAERASAVIRRALDLGLHTTYRPSRLAPLFDDEFPTGPTDHPTGGPAAEPAARPTDRPAEPIHQRTAQPNGGPPAQPIDRPAGGPAHQPHRHGVVLEIGLRAPQGTLPAGFLDALHRDPFTLLCRRVGDGDTVLMQYRHASPLADGALLELAAGHTARDLPGLPSDRDARQGQERQERQERQEDATGAWLLSAAEYGCARLVRLGAPLDAAALVALAADHPLYDVGEDPDWADARPTAPPAPRLTVVPARTPGAAVDAVLLPDAHLDAVQLMLEGHPLADIVQVVPGRDHHLLLAAGGLLERLPLGDALYCVGPGPLYLPLGCRTEPLLPPSARQALFQPDARRAVVLTAGAVFAFELPRRRPVWELWAGPVPELDLQLPPDAEDILRAVDTALTPTPKPEPTAPPPTQRNTPPHQRPWPGQAQPPTVARGWRDRALDAELSGDLVHAAEIHEYNGDTLRAAHLYERAARESTPRRRWRR